MRTLVELFDKSLECCEVVVAEQGDRIKLTSILQLLRRFCDLVDTILSVALQYVDIGPLR